MGETTMMRGRTDRDDDSWRRIEQEALIQVRAELCEEDMQTLPVGHLVAWTDCRFARTDGLSAVHRVGEPIGNVAVMLCGEIMPSTIRLLPLNANLIRVLGRCPDCEYVYTKQRVAP